MIRISYTVVTWLSIYLPLHHTCLASVDELAWERADLDHCTVADIHGDCEEAGGKLWCARERHCLHNKYDINRGVLYVDQMTSNSYFILCVSVVNRSDCWRVVPSIAEYCRMLVITAESPHHRWATKNNSSESHEESWRVWAMMVPRW